MFPAAGISFTKPLRLLSTLFALGSLLIFAGATDAASTHPPEVEPPPFTPAEYQAPACINACNKSGGNTAYPVRQPLEIYDQARYLGMGWILEIAYHPVDLERTIEAISRAHDYGLKPILRICAGSSCAFSNPDDYVQFLQEIAAEVDGEFWALMGPNEPDLEPWAGDAAGVAAYMNAVMAQVEDIPNLRMVSPAFNLTNGITHTFFSQMEAAGARFADLDAFAGNSYTVAGNGAYYYYAYNTGHAEKMRQKVLRYNKPFIFTEYGTFDLINKQTEGDPARVPVIAQMKAEFTYAANDPTVMAVLHYDVFGLNSTGFRLYDAEIVEVTRDTNCASGTGFTAAYNQVGVGYSTGQTLWQIGGEPTCREFTYGCPFTSGVACPSGACIDSDGDGYLGDGGDAACTRNDCDDTDPTRGLSCGGGIPDQAADWGTVRVIDDQVSSSGAAIWPILKVPWNGLPLIAYHNGTTGRKDLSLITCTTPACTAAQRRVLTSVDWVGTFLSMTLRYNGRPLLAHLDEIDDDFEVYDCFDPVCLAGQSRIIDYETGHYGFDTSMALRPDGRPIIAYWHSSYQDLHVFDCVDIACSGGTIRPLEQSDMVGYDPTVVIGADQNPLIAYSQYDASQLRLWDCANGDCTAGGRITLVDGNAEGFPTHAMAVRSSGLPLIVYRSRDVSAVKLYDCASPDCSTGTSRDLYTGSDVQSASIVLLADDSPFIAISDRNAGDYDLVLLRCLDSSCTAMASTTYTAGSAGAQPDAALRPDGRPLIAFHDAGNGDLLLYDIDAAKLPGGVPVPVVTTPEKPAWLAAMPSWDQGIYYVDLAWEDHSLNEDGFRIQVSPDGADWTTVAEVGANQERYRHSGLACETRYFHRILAYNSGGASSPTNVTNKVTGECRPYKPDTTGVFRPSNGYIYLKNSHATGFADQFQVYGIAGDLPVAGDWDGDGVDSIGVYRGGVFYLRNDPSACTQNCYADVVIPFGTPGDLPLAGDWDADGVDEVGVYRAGTFYLVLSDLDASQLLTPFGLGIPGDAPIAGDWDGDGDDTVGVFRPSNGWVYLKLQNTTGFADQFQVYGVAGDLPLAGDWDGDGVGSIGVYRNGVFYLRNDPSACTANCFADIIFQLGNPGDMPIAGDWDGVP